MGDRDREMHESSEVVEGRAQVNAAVPRLGHTLRVVQREPVFVVEARPCQRCSGMNAVLEDLASDELPERMAVELENGLIRFATRAERTAWLLGFGQGWVFGSDDSVPREGSWEDNPCPRWEALQQRPRGAADDEMSDTQPGLIVGGPCPYCGGARLTEGPWMYEHAPDCELYQRCLQDKAPSEGSAGASEERETEPTYCERCGETGTGPCQCDRTEAQGQEDARELERVRAELHGLRLRYIAAQDLACKVLAVLEDEPHKDAVPIVVELLNEHLEAGDLTMDFARLGQAAAVAGAQDEQANLLEALADELERMPGQTQAIAEDLAERDSCLLVETWLGRLWGMLREARTPERWCTHCRVMTRDYDPAFKLHNECGQMTASTSEGASDDGDDGDRCTSHDCINAEWWCDRCQDFVAPGHVAAPAADLPARHIVCGGDLRLRCACDDSDPCTDATLKDTMEGRR